MLAGVKELTMKLFGSLAVGGMGFFGGIKIPKVVLLSFGGDFGKIFIMVFFKVYAFVTSCIIGSKGNIIGVVTRARFSQVFNSVVVRFICIYVIKAIRAVSVMELKNKTMRGKVAPFKSYNPITSRPFAPRARVAPTD